MNGRVRTTLTLVIGLIITLAAFASVMLLTIAPASSAAQPTQLTSGPQDDKDLTYSPNGGIIAFASNRGGTYAIWSIDSNGRRATRLTTLPGNQRSPSFSPDGKTIAFLETTNGTVEIETVDSSTLKVARVTWDGMPKGVFDWSPDGKAIVYDLLRNGTWTIWLSSLNGTQPRMLSPSTESSRYPSFTPDGGSILYSSFYGGSYKIWRMNLTAMSAVQLTQGAGNDIRPTASPDGRYLAFFSDRTGKLHLWTMTSNGTGLAEADTHAMPLTSIPEASSESMPTWIPDGTAVLYYTTAADNDSDVYVFYLRATVTTVILPNYVFTQEKGPLLTKLASTFATEISPVFDSRDNGVCYSSNASGSFNIWRTPLGSASYNPYG